MPRAQSSDYYHVMKFHVLDAGQANLLGQKTVDGAVAGFTGCTVPELSIESVEYKEGIWTYRRKYPGNPTVGDVSLRRGVIKTQTGFYDWVMMAIKGNEYRIDFVIKQYHRDDVKNLTDYTTARASRIIQCFNAFPIRVKPGADFDANTGDVSVEELDVAMEYFVVSTQ